MRPWFGRLGPRLPVLAFVGLFVLLPVGLLIAAGMATIGGPAAALAVVADPLNLAALTNSLVQGGLSAIVAVALGYPLGVLLGRYHWPGRRVVRSILLVPFLLPSLVVVLGISELFAPGTWPSVLWPGSSGLGGGLGGIVAVNVAYNAPVVALLTAVGVESAAPELEEAIGTLGGSPASQYTRGWGPPSWLGAAAGGVLTFLLSALAFAAPLLLCGGRCSTLEVRVWALDQTFLNPSAAAVLAFWTILLLAGPALGYLALASRLRSARFARPARRIPIPWLSWTTPLLALPSGILGLLEAGILSSVVTRSFFPPGASGPSAAAWSQLFSLRATAVLGLAPGTLLLNTGLFAAASASLALLLAVLSGAARGARSDGGIGVRFVAFLPLLVSPVILAFGLAETWERVTGSASSAWLWIIVSQATLALPFVLQTLRSSLARVPSGLGETARTLGASPMAALLDVELPSARGGFVAAGLFALAFGLGEFTATNFLATPGFTTLSVAIPHLEALRLVPASWAAAALLLFLSAAAFGTGLAVGEALEV
jgi:thiamine transport system permease protein